MIILPAVGVSASEPRSAETRASYGRNHGKMVDRAGNEFTMIAGAVRCCTASGRWILIDDARHEPINLSINHRASGRNLVIKYPSSMQVVSLSANPDEHFARAGIDAGASVGLSSAVFWCARNGVRVSCNRLRQFRGNFFIQGWMVAPGAAIEEGTVPN